MELYLNKTRMEQKNYRASSKQKNYWVLFEQNNYRDLSEQKNYRALENGVHCAFLKLTTRLIYVHTSGHFIA